MNYHVRVLMINKNFRTHDKLDDILGGGLGGPLHLFLGIEMGEEREDGDFHFDCLYPWSFSMTMC